MQTAPRFRLFAPALFVVLLGAAPTRGQVPERGLGGDSPSAGHSLEIVLEGVIRGADGAPAADVVVVSSVGGRATTDEHGRYALTVSVAPGVEAVQLTAFDGRGGRASASVPVFPQAFGATPRTTLTLAAAVPTAQWLPAFGSAPMNETLVTEFAEYDDGHGLALFAAGSFQRAGGTQAQRIARWNGTHWHAIGALDGDVHALAVYDDGDGPGLYVGGEFTTAGGVAAPYLARWDGTSWSAVAEGLPAPVRALAVIQDAAGESLFASTFTTGAGRVHRYNGHFWAQLGGTMNDRVLALEGFDDGSGTAVYAGGVFSMIDGTGARLARVAKWDGFAWQAVGAGVSDIILELRAFDDGSGPGLFAGTHTALVKWNTATWTAVPGAESIRVQALTVFDPGGGPGLFVAGDFNPVSAVLDPSIARWDGTSFTEIGVTPVNENHALIVHDDGSGAKLFVGRQPAFGSDEPSVVTWDGTSWSQLGDGLDDAVYDLVEFDDGSGPALFVAGEYTSAGKVASFLGKWDGTNWEDVPGLTRSVKALKVHDDGSGPALFVGGHFLSASGITGTSRIAKWDGAGWAALGSGINRSVLALELFDAGGGPELYAAGDFELAGGLAANNIARWDGSSWHPLGSGLNKFATALAVFDDGSGPALFATGFFTFAGGVPANYIAKWDGTSWSPLSIGLDAPTLNWPTALRVFDDGTGEALYVAGFDGQAGGVPLTSLIAKWDGSAWSTLGSGLGGSMVNALAVHDDGSGVALYVGGNFLTAGGLAANGIARWDGSSWSALGAGMDSGPFDAGVAALVSFDDGAGHDLFAGGLFHATFDSGDSFLARWGIDEVPPVLQCPADLTVLDRRANGFGEIVQFTVEATDNVTEDPQVVCTPPSGSVFPRGTTLVTCTATDGSGNEVSCQFSVTVRANAAAATKQQP